MALPDGFSEWEHLREQLTVGFNLQVEQSFPGLQRDNIGNPLESMFQACLIKDDDTVDMIMLRMYLYYWVFKGDLPAPIFGIPSASFEETVVFKPQVRLFFKEDYSVERAREKIPSSTAEIKIRIKNVTDQTITTAELNNLANSIKEFFGEGKGFTWEKGRTMVRYKDRSHGYYLQLYAASEAEGIRVIRQVLEIQQDPFNETLIRSTKILNEYPTGKHPILNKEVNYPRKYPTAMVRFRSAEAYLATFDKPIHLVDMSGRAPSLA